MANDPTPYPDVNALLHELLVSARAVLGPHFVSMYLDGSLTSDHFDRDSDIDFVIVTEEDVAGALFTALQAMHDRIATLDSPWAIQLEGSYLSRQAIRQYDPDHALHPNIERGNGERLKMVVHDSAWAVHRYVLRERGITLTGPAPQTMIDPVSPDELRRAVRESLRGWAAHFLNDPALMTHRGYQSYVVLTLCRILYTLQHGTVVSKPVAARWTQETFGDAWAPLIEQAWAGRQGQPWETPADRLGEVEQTLSFIRFTIERGRLSEMR